MLQWCETWPGSSSVGVCGLGHGVTLHRKIMHLHWMYLFEVIADVDEQR